MTTYLQVSPHQTLYAPFLSPTVATPLPISPPLITSILFDERLQNLKSLFCGLVHTLLLYRPSLAQVSLSALRYRTPLGFTLNMTDHLRKKNQLDALFILSLFRQSTSSCFGHICSPSSGGILYVYNSWYVLRFLVGYLLVWLGWNQANRQSIENYSTYQL